MAGLIQQWGLGAVLSFDGTRAQAGLTKARQAVQSVRASFRQLGDTAANVASGLGQIAVGLAPISGGFLLLGKRSSDLAASLEAQKITFDTLLGSQEKSAQLMGLISQYAAETPFEEGDLLEGSKRLLRITRDNVGANVQLLKTMGQLTALNPTKNITDAVEAMLDASSGGGFERLKEFGITYKTEDFKAAGEAGSEAFAQAVQDRLTKDITKMTGGRDLVKALSETFMGRMSTMKDAGTAMLKAIGKGINAELGPMLVPITDWIAKQTPAIVLGVTDHIKAARAIFDTYIQPLFTQLLGFWESLGEGGKAKVVGLVMTIASIGTALLTVGAAFVVLSPIISGIGTIASAVFGLLSPSMLLPIAGALAIIGGAAFGFFQIFKQQGEGPLAFAVRMFHSLVDVVKSVVGYVGDLVTAFGRGIGGPLLESFTQAIDMVKPSVMQLYKGVSDLISSLSGDGADLSFWEGLGGFIGGVLGFAFRSVAVAVDLVLIALDILRASLAPVLASIWQIAKGFIGLLTGSMGFGDFVANIGRGLMGLMLGAANIVAQVVIGLLQMVVKAVQNIVRAIPGLGNFTGLDTVAGALEKGRSEFANTVTQLTQGTYKSADERAAAAAKAGAPTVNVSPGETKNEVNVNTSVKVDGKEIARATGDASVRAGERGTGPSLPPQTRGKVLRRGLNVTPLGASEVLPVGG